MKRTVGAVVLLCTSALFGCQQDAPTSHESLGDAYTANSIKPLDDQAYLVQLLKKSEIADSKRSLVHVSHTCTLIIDEQNHTVIDMRELVKGATSARGMNQILLLNAENQLISKIEYGDARPLFCEKNKLYLHGDVIPDGQAEEGNVLVFTDSGFAVTAVKEDVNAKLPVE